MPKITAELLEKLESWRRAGDRSVKLEQSSRKQHHQGWAIWIYDYEVMSGIYLEEGDFDKDWNVLLLTDKREALKKDLAELDKKLGGVA